MCRPVVFLYIRPMAAAVSMKLILNAICFQIYVKAIRSIIVKMKVDNCFRLQKNNIVIENIIVKEAMRLKSGRGH